MLFSELLVKKILKLFAGLAFLVLFLILGYHFLNIIVMLLIALLLSLIFNPVVTFLERNGIKRIFSVLLVFAIGSVLIVLALSVLIPKIISQLNTITLTLSKENFANFIQQIEDAFKNYIPLKLTTNIADQLSEYLSSLFFTSIDNISEIVSSIVSILAISIIVPFMTFFLLKDYSALVKAIINIMPNKYFEMSYSIITSINKQLGRFVRGWILDAFLVGVMAAIGLTILGIKNSITIGFVAGIGHLIPYFGPVIGGLPAIIISLIQFGDFSMLPSITIMFTIIYTFDNGYLQPNLFSKSTDIHPLMIIILILIGSQLLGVIGMLLAVPIATVIKTASREIYYGFKYYKISRV
jgi:predicted PurR-regulated permease PerM